MASSSAFLRLAAANTVMSAACAKAQKNGVTSKPSASATNKPRRLDFADIQHVCTGNKIEARHGSAQPLTGWRLIVRFWHLADIETDAEHFCSCG